MPCKNCKKIGHNSRTCQLLKEPMLIETIDSLKLPIEPLLPNKKYYCYIVKQVNDKRDLTYVGYTVKPERRIRQHNGLIVGSARYTRNRGPWEFLVVMSCPTWNNIRALCVEWLIKHPTRRRKTPKCFYGAKGRINSMIEVFQRIPEEEQIEMYVNTNYYDQAKNLKLPENINLREVLNF